MMLLSKKIHVAICVLLCMLCANSVTAAAAEVSEFELPIAGTTGYGVIDLVVRAEDDPKSDNWGTIPAGTAFTILEEGNTRFKILTQNKNVGWVSKDHTMVNLPDLLPSIRYNATNSYDSKYRSCGNALPEVTGKGFYIGKTWNAKLGYEEYNVPVLFGMAKKIAVAQSAALADGRTLVVYEGYRPLEVQQTVNVGLSSLMKGNAAVSKAVNSWGQGWFIAKKVSNHQKGYAIDVSLAEVTGWENREMDGRTVRIPAGYAEMAMPTAMHELSPAAASMAYGVNSLSASAWKSIPMAKGMTDAAKVLRAYCVNAGMSPLASEWWHFNDLDARAVTNAAGNGIFQITGNVSAALG